MRRRIASTVLAAGVLAGTLVGVTATSASAVVKSYSSPSWYNCEANRKAFVFDGYQTSACNKVTDQYGTVYRVFYW